jgi:hypothetical protein
MADEASWHLPSGPVNWFVFACSLLFCLIGAFAVFAEPVASQGWWFGLGGIALGGASAVSTLWDPPQRRDRVTFDDEQVVRTLANGQVESVRWSDLQQVSIMTTSDGPRADDIFFLLHGEGNLGCAIPQSADGVDALLARLQELPGFDNEAVVRAMGSSSEAVFVCWKRTA